MDIAKIRKQIQLKKSKQEYDASMVSIIKDIVKAEGIGGLFVGLPLKCCHTVISTFCFFYISTFLRHRIGGKLSTKGHLLLNSVAGAVNMSITLPLEVLTTKQQTGAEGKAWRKVYDQYGIRGFWRGYVASLVLVSNPAINFTIFDMCKARLQRMIMLKNGVLYVRALTMLQAFLLGIFAKSIATVCTYPLIRAKVIMQAQKKNKGSNEMGNSLVQVLFNIGRVNGVGGYFKGCYAQLFNTALKSALLLMTKEQITKYTMQILYKLEKNKNKLRVNVK